jgi:hypothetical protein
MLEEMETTNEELKSSKQEYQSVNQEAQSSNEELEVSKEELPADRIAGRERQTPAAKRVSRVPVMHASATS